MPQTNPHFTNLDAVVNYEMRRWTVPGMAVGILHNGEVTTKGYGVASLETGQPVVADTIFQVGSISKVFCATLVMNLVDEGKLNLDTPVAEYLPDFQLADKQAQDTITLRHLLSHTSGIFGDDFQDFGMGEDALEKAVANYGNLRQYTAPGELWSYCNSGFDLAGRVIEAVLGQPFEQAMRERVIEPLGLERAFYFAHEAIVYPVAVGHTQVTPASDEHQVARQFAMPRRNNPCGGVLSTVGDLLKFAQFHMGDGMAGDKRVLSADSVAAMHQEQTKAANFADAWGIGWDIQYIDGTTVIGHGGSTNGYQALLQIVPDKGFAIAMLSNSGRGNAAESRIFEWALEHYCGLKRIRPPVTTMADEQLARFAGTYKTPIGSGVAEVADGGLEFKFAFLDEDSGETIDFPPFSLKPISALEFLCIDGPFEGMRVDFILGDGDAVRFIRAGGRVIDRVEEESLAT